MDENRTEMNVPATPEENHANRTIEVDLEKEMKKSFLEYSMSVIVSRALPDVRDGLKPVHRRILYTMHENNLTPDKPYRKCADTVGAVLGRYHPHGDASVYDAMVRLAQDFSMRYPLIDGHGNFGSIDGHPAAAYRYTESRMNKMALDMLVDIDKDTVDFDPNYDDRLQEPRVLPSRFPNLLVNGSLGIAVGMATNIPPHNLCEVVDAICLLIDKPDAELPEIMECIKGPDFPTGGVIMGRSGIRAAYATGRGRIIVRARTEIEEGHNGRFRIVVSEIPYQVNKLNLVKSIVELADEKRVEGIHDVVDHSSREGMRIVIDLKKDANPQVVLNQLFMFTQMQVTFGAIMLALVDGVPRILPLKAMLEQYISFQEEVIARRTRFELKKASERAHILDALKTASDFIDEVIALIRGSADKTDAKRRLSERFGFDDAQTEAIVRMQLGQLAGLERQKIEDELGALRIRVAELEAILADEQKIKAIVKTECLRMRDKYGDERRTEISTVCGEMDIEDLIPVEDCVLTMSQLGYIKRQTADTFQLQNRGGRGIKGMSTREEDSTARMFFCSSHDYILFFTTAGRVYRIKAYEVPEGSRQSKGMNIVNLLPIEGDEKVSAMIRVSGLEEDGYLCMITRRGVLKRTRLEAFANVRKGGLIAVDLDEGDHLASVLLTDGYQSLLVATRDGMAIRFDENDARVVGRTARGVRAISLGENDEVVGMSACTEGAYLLTVTETGYGRLSPLTDYRIQSRGGKGLTNYHTDRFGAVAAAQVVTGDEDVILVSDAGIVIRIRAEQVRVCRRPSKGVRVMRVDENSRLIAMAVVPHDENEADDELPVEEDTDADEGADEGADA